MRLKLRASVKHFWWGLILGFAAMLSDPVSLRASSGEVRYVQVQSVLGQMYDAVIDADDTETFGLSIPRGSALPRRMYPVMSFGMPMIHKLEQPQYQDVLLRYPQRNYTEYLDPHPESSSTVSLPVITVSRLVGALGLAWSEGETGWQLFTSTNLVAPVWTIVPVVGAHFIAVPTIHRQQYFRLGRPE